jgi:hypothetical protein
LPLILECLNFPFLILHLFKLSDLLDLHYFVFDLSEVLLLSILMNGLALGLCINIASDLFLPLGACHVYVRPINIVFRYL